MPPRLGPSARHQETSCADASGAARWRSRPRHIYTMCSAQGRRSRRRGRSQDGPSRDHRDSAWSGVSHRRPAWPDRVRCATARSRLIQLLFPATPRIGLHIVYDREVLDVFAQADPSGMRADGDAKLRRHEHHGLKESFRRVIICRHEPGYFFRDLLPDGCFAFSPFPTTRRPDEQRSARKRAASPPVFGLNR